VAPLRIWLDLETRRLEGDRWQGGVHGVGCVSIGKGLCLLDERGRLKLKGCEVLAAGQTCLLGGLRIRLCVKNKASSIPLLSTT
jgi:hypothetical protein